VQVSSAGDDKVFGNHFQETYGRGRNLTPIRPLSDRLRVWQRLTGSTIELFVGDVTEYDFLSSVIKDFEPEAVVYFAEQRAAPYSMIDRKHAVFTQVNNVVAGRHALVQVPQELLVNKIEPEESSHRALSGIP